MQAAKFFYLTGSSLVLTGHLATGATLSADKHVFENGDQKAFITTTQIGDLRAYSLSSNAPLRDNTPDGKRVDFAENPTDARLRSGNLMFDGLYALANFEAHQNSVAQIKDGAYANDEPLDLNAFETGRAWHYVWTRDLSYATHLGLAGFDTQRAINSLLFKASIIKSSVSGGFTNQIIQDTGSGGSYPISTDRIVWSLGAAELAKHLPQDKQGAFLAQVYPFLRDTIEQDRRLVFDDEDGLYQGEQSFLDWREQTYPLWTKDNVLPIGVSKALSVNVANYFALITTAQIAEQLDQTEDQKRYSQWASQLKTAINSKFYDEETGLYSTYLLTDIDHAVQVQRYDLLGESLAILFGVASNDQAKKIVSNYPIGRYGPPVVWPQEQTVPIYHNHAMWPFVTAYWLKAARKTDNVEAVNRGIYSLVRGAALNLSNMENLDLDSGRAWANSNGIQGPVINSQRQIWSVAGYLAMVQDVIFGMETSWQGVRFEPFVTAQLRNETLTERPTVELLNLPYRGKTIDIRLHLPPIGATEGVCRVARTELNGKRISSAFVPASSLAAHNKWDIFLEAPQAQTQDTGKVRVVSDSAALFAPRQPEWEDGDITLENGLLTLHFQQPDSTKVSFNIYRDGQLCAQNVTTPSWTDTRSEDFANTIHFYSVAAVDKRNGNVSHLTPTRFYKPEGTELILLAKNMHNQGGNLVDDHHFENWGQTQHELRVQEFTVPRDGQYQLRAEFSNGAGPINSGITCAVKRVEIYQNKAQRLVTAGYFIMPQSGDWKRFDLSSVVRAHLQAGESYSLRLGEDMYSRNMSYLQKNERYTAASGGGEAPYNYVNIASIRLLRVSN